MLKKGFYQNIGPMYKYTICIIQIIVVNINSIILLVIYVYL